MQQLRGTSRAAGCEVSVRSRVQEEPGTWMCVPDVGKRHHCGGLEVGQGSGRNCRLKGETIQRLHCERGWGLWVCVRSVPCC